MKKYDFRKLCFGLLKKNGIYFSIDDRLGETEEEHEKICYNWDKFVAKQLSDPNNIDSMSKKNKAFSDKLSSYYKQGVITIEKVQRLREARRISCQEEIEKFSKTYSDFVDIFGGTKVFFEKHPLSSHSNFYLIWGVK